MLQISKLKTYLSAMEVRGFGAEETLANSGLCTQDLNSNLQVISLSQTQVIINNMLSLSGNDALGFEIGGEAKISDMGLLGHAMIAAPNFRQTIELWKRFASALYGSLLKLEIVEAETGGEWGVSLSAPLSEEPCYRFFIEEYLAISLTVGHLMPSLAVSYGGVNVTYRAPKHFALYDSLYHCPINFSADNNLVLVQHPKLDDLMETRDKQLFDIYHRYCQRQSRHLAQQGDCTYLIHRYLIKNLGSPPNQETAAQELGFSSRTLKRRLHLEGTSFRDLVTEFRHDFSRENLRDSAMTIKEVAYLLGYQDTKPFLRAFKRWTGQTVGEYRNGA